MRRGASGPPGKGSPKSSEGGGDCRGAAEHPPPHDRRAERVTPELSSCHDLLLGYPCPRLCRERGTCFFAGVSSASVTPTLEIWISSLSRQKKSGARGVHRPGFQGGLCGVCCLISTDSKPALKVPCSHPRAPAGPRSSGLPS